MTSVRRWIALASGLVVFTALAEGAGAADPAIALRGSVSDAAGKPVKAALVRAQAKGSEMFTVAISDDRGTFTVPHLAAGPHEIIVSKEGFESAVSTEQLPLAKPYQASIKELPTIPIDQMRDIDIIRHMPDDNPARTARGGGGGVQVPVAEQSAKTLVRDRCIRCHSLGLVMAQGRTKAEWEEVVTRMGTYPVGSKNPVGYGLTNNPAVKARIIDYLAKHMGPDKPATPMLEQAAKKSYTDEIPVGSGVVYTEWPVPTEKSMPHTAVPDKRGNVWVTEYGVGQIGKFEISTGKYTAYKVTTEFGNPHGITVGADGVVWYTIPGGNLGRVDPTTGKVEEFVPPKGIPAGLNVIVARNGMVLYAAPGGIATFDPKTRQFGAIVVDPAMASPYALVQSQENEDIIWLCVEGQNRAGYINIKTGESNILHTNLPGPKRPRIDSKGRVFFGYYEGGAVGMIDPKTMTLKDFVLPYRGSAYAIHVDDRDQVWVASYERGSMIQLDPDSGKMTEYPWPSPGGIVRDIWPDERGNMWFVFFGWTHNTVVRVERPVGPVKSAQR